MFNKKNNKPQAADKKQNAAKKNTKNRSGVPTDDQVVATIGKNRSFAMAEAHKRLRTNIMFSFADEGACHVIGVTSAMAHEGKSTTSMNLAYDLMEAGKKTLLIDADMRLSRIAKYLEIKSAPGLSNMLVGKNSDLSAIQVSTVQNGLNVITCGDIPPNPTELLASKRFESMIDTLKETYEYIIIDLPPVTEVADALIASQLADGMIVVVRQEFADKRLLDDTIMQLNMGGARILGLVMTCVEHATKYGKYKYKKYGTRKYGYHGGYYGGYKRYGYYSRGYHSHYGYGSPYEHSSHEHHTNKNQENKDS